MVVCLLVEGSMSFQHCRWGAFESKRPMGRLYSFDASGFGDSYTWTLSSLAVSLEPEHMWMICLLEMVS